MDRKPEESAQALAGQPGDDTRKRILQAAASVFAEKGYARATTRALAAAAGVSEVTLFRRFGNKQNLFAAIIDEFAARALTSEMEAQFTGEYRQDLLTMGNLVMEAMIQRQEAMRMMLCEATHFPEVREVLVQNPRRLRLSLARYLEQQMVQGRVRRGHPEAMAQAFWGMFFAYSISFGVFSEPVRPTLSTEELVSHFVDIFIDGTAQRE